jgi:flagellar basal-body rod protein FlgB
VLQTVSKGFGVKPWFISIEGETPMYQDLNVFRLAHAMAQHAGLRQTVVAENMANADTPNYLVRDVEPFRTVMDGLSQPVRLVATRPGHITQGSGAQLHWSTFQENAATDPNGNSVSVELEMVKAVETLRQHDRALAIYKSSLGQLRSSLGKL